MPSIEKRILKRGEVSYRVKVRLEGYPDKTQSFKRKADAKAWGMKTELDLRAGKLQGEFEAKKFTASQMIDRYLEDVLENKSSKKRYLAGQKVQLLWWKRNIGDYSLDKLSRFVLSEMRDRLAGKNFSKRKAGTVNRYLSALNHVLETAIKEWGWLSVNPMKQVRKPKEPRGRVRFLSKSERERVLLAATKVSEECGKPLYLIMLLAMTSGARKTELLEVEPDHVDLERGLLRVYETKNDEPRSLFIDGIALEELKKFIAKQSFKGKFLFENRKTGKPMRIDRENRRVFDRAKVTNFRFHDLRHTAASYLAMSGASLAEIAEVLGHKSLDMVKRYAHLCSSHTSGVVKKMSDKMLRGAESKAEGAGPPSTPHLTGNARSAGGG